MAYTAKGGVFIDVGKGSRCVGDNHAILIGKAQCECGRILRKDCLELSEALEGRFGWKVGA